MKRSKETRPSRKDITCYHCKVKMSLEHWKVTHCKTAHPNIKYPRYTDPDSEAITKHFAPKQNKVRCAQLKGLSSGN